jgi:hypothetical protein
MLKYRILGVAAFLSAAVATPALAEVIQEPGAYAFVYPNGDLGLGYSKPTDAMAQTMRRDTAAMRMSVPAHRAHRAPANRHY